jgi:enolase 1/2/3
LGKRGGSINGDWLDRYPIVSIEDPLAEHDAAGFPRFTKAVGHRVQIVGDDFLVTDAGRLRRAAAMPAWNAILGEAELSRD